MWMDAHEIDEALGSRESGRVVGGLRALVEHLDDYDTWPMPAPSIDALGPGPISDEVAADLIRLWTGWPDLDPPLSDAERCRRLVTLVGRAPTSRVAYTVAVELRTAGRPDPDAAIVVDAVAALPTPPADAYVALVDHLLDGAPEMRRATVAALVARKDEPAVSAVIAGLRGGFTEEERSRLDP